MSSLFPLMRSANKDEAQKKAGHDMVQWSRFYIFTRDEAKNIAQEHPDWNWLDVPANQQSESLRRVNILLAKEQCPEVEEDVYSWRMNKVLRNARRAPANNLKKAAEAAARDTETSRPMPFDPVRDL